MPPARSTPRRLSRRSALRWTTLGALTSPFGFNLLLEACAPAPAAGGPTSASAAPTTSTAGRLQLPTYVSFQGPAPDQPGSDQGVQPVYVHYPKNPVKSVTAPPGRGGQITALTNTVNAPPTPMDQNPAWQAVNQQLGATLNINVVAASDYPPKLATAMAGSDLPELLFIFQGGPSPVPSLLQFLQARCADLTSYLAGDAIKDYPNLANFPTYNWQGTGTTYGSSIWGVPVPRSVLASCIYVHQELLDAVGATLPRSADDFKRLLADLTRPQDNHWGIGSSSTMAFFVPSMFLQIFGGPNNWRLESSGKLTKDYETDEFKAATGYVRDLVQAGVFHPNSASAGVLGADGDFTAGRYAFYYSTWLALSTVLWPQSARLGPNIRIRGVDPFSAEGKSKPVFFLGIGNFGNTYLTKNSPDRIKELLGVLNFLAAPFGTQEQMLMSYGLPGMDYQLTPDGDPVPVASNSYVYNPVPFRYLTQYPGVQYNTTNPAEYAQTVHPTELAMAAVGIQDPTLSLYSPSFANLNASLKQSVNDGVTDIVQGRRPLSDLDSIVADWRNKGGDTIRNEYQAALASA
ncbi:MAG: extracellular solute-binding protein [Chloroflexi bacterium]|nr:extracellular solute-binding protein [Chloroflexota bacterium]